MKKFLLLIEYDKNNFSENEYNQYILNLKKRNYNFIYCIISNRITNITCADIIYICDSKFCFLEVIKKINFNYDYLIHIRNLSYINYNFIINYDYSNDTIYTSNDKYNFSCRIMHNSILSNLNKDYYDNTDFITIKCLYKVINEKIRFISENESRNLYIQDFKKPTELISIIMTTYNSINTIEDAIISILDQTYTFFDFIIIDDGSTDDTCNIINKYMSIDKRIKFIKLKKNYGCYYAKNIGLKNMSKHTKYIAFQDSDDISLISRIYKQYGFMKKKHISMSTCLYFENSKLKMPMISKMFSINIFNSLGYFGPKRFGEDEHFYNRFFCLFTKNHSWNNSTIYNSNNIGYFKKYNFYENLSDILYIVKRHANSLTKTITEDRKKFSEQMIVYYKHLNGKSLSLKKKKCFYTLDYVNSKIREDATDSKKIKDNNKIIINNLFPSEIKQAYVSESLNHLKKRFLEKYEFKEFYTYKLPCLFFGLYTPNDIKIFTRIKNKRYIIWGGTDLDLTHKLRYNNFKNIINCSIEKHYAISNDLVLRMNKIKLNHERINLNLLDENAFYPITLKGDHIFIYNGFGKGNEDIYGKVIYEKLIKQLPYSKFIFSNQLNIPNYEMHNIYKKCFIGLRLTTHDGNANMVQELIKMNIPIIHNGDYDKAIKWNNISDILKNIKNNMPKILIIFKKDMNLHDGSLVWLYNFIDLIKEFYNNTAIIIYCKVIDTDININNVTFVDNITNFNFDHIFFRITDDNIQFKYYNNISLIIHSFDINNIKYYKKFKYIIAQSELIKDELKFNNFNNISILPPLIKNINYSTSITKSNIISFCYCGTIKQSYQSLEMLKLFESLSINYNFEFNLIYGKIKKDNEYYDNNLFNLILKLKNNKKFNIYHNIKSNAIKDIIKKCHYGIVIHSDDTDYKQQSTKLIEYLSEHCIPITYLTYLNSGYITKNLNFRSINDLKDLIEKILNNEILYNEIEINYLKLEKHLIKNNSQIFKQEYNTFITQKKVNNIKKMIITNNYVNLFLNENVIYIENNYNTLENIRNIIENQHIVTNKKYDITTNFIFNDNNFNITYLDMLFNFKYDKKYLEFNDIQYYDDIYNFKNNDSYIEFNCYLIKKYDYYINFNSEILNDGILFLLSITDVNGVLKDINRNIHYVKNTNESIQFMIKPKNDSNYIFKLIPSKRNNNNLKIKILNFEIKKIISINKICDKIKIINMDKEKNKFYDIYNTFENNGVLCERAIGVDGQAEKIKNQFEIYKKIPFNKKEEKLGRKLIISTGAIGYLYSMLNIFEDAIINNYEYIMICDDDIRIINNFIFKFTELYNDIKGNFRLLMLGSSQWEWDNIKYDKKFYNPNEYSNGSFSNIYHRTIFDNIYNYILKFTYPFDDEPMKCNFLMNYCYVSYPNIIIAQLEDSNIRKVNKNRSYERFRWDKINYNYIPIIDNSNIIYQKLNNRICNKLFIIGVVTYNRCSYLKLCLESLFKNLSNDIDYILIIADGKSVDNTEDYIKNLIIPLNISLILITNEKHFIYRQSNSILKYAKNLNFDFGFLINDDIIFKNPKWDINYYSAYKKTNFDHLVFFDIKFKNSDHYHHNQHLQSYCKPENCQGAFFTFTKKLIEEVGYFDEENFKIRGHSHIDYTIRCCRKKFNDINYLYDLVDSNHYLVLNNDDYISSFVKLPFFLRELYKVDIYEQDRRNKILYDSTREFIDSNFQFK